MRYADPEAQKRIDELEAKLETLRGYWLASVEANSFYINGFDTRIDQLQELYGEDAARNLIEVLS